MNAVDAFLSVAKLAGKRVPGLDVPATVLSLESNREQAAKELKDTGKLSDATYMNFASDVVGIGAIMKMIIKSIILFAIVMTITLLAVFYIDFGQYKFLCDAVIFILWPLAYIMIIIKNTLYLLKNSFKMRVIAKKIF